MARMYSRKKGKAGSKKPDKKQTPSWSRYKGKEVELLVVKLAKEGKNPSQIGLYLRDVYGIPDAKTVCEKSITAILKEKDLQKEIPEDLMALIKRSVQLRKHMLVNTKDQTAKRGLLLTESKIKRLIKYYKLNNRLPEGWKYDPEKAGLFLE
ncbi:30S ribosomal protein S15 [Nanoarchaeota archaeon]